MEAQSLFIQQLVFNATFTVKEEAYALQNRISKLYGDKLHQLLQSFFETHIPPEVIVKFDSLQLDLGNIPYEYLEDEITERLLNALKEHFPDHKLNDNNTFTANNEGNYTVQSLTSGLLHLLEIYLTTGSLPWWSANENIVDLQEKFRLLMADEPTKVREVILKIGQSDNIRKRIAWQLNDITIAAIIYILEPVEAGFILEYHAGMVKLQNDEQLVKSETNAFEKDIWYFIITFLIKEYGSNFNRKSFVKTTIQSIAAHYNIDYKSLLQFFNKATYAEFIVLEQADFIRVIKEIFAEEKIIFSDNLNEQNNVLKKENNITKETIIAYYLNYGSLPTASQQLDIEDITSIFLDLVTNEAAYIKKILLGLAPKITMQRLWQLNNKHLKNEVLKLLAEEKINDGILKISDKEISTFEKVEAGFNDWNKTPLQQITGDIVGLELLKFFFTYGSFPKTWPNIKNADAAYLFEHLADKKSYALKALLKQFKAKKIIKLLQVITNKNLFSRLIHLLQPSFLNSILEQQQLLETILAKYQNNYISENSKLFILQAALEILLEQPIINYETFEQQWLHIIITKFKDPSKAIADELTNFATTKQLNLKQEFTTGITKENSVENIEEKSLVNLLRYFIVYGAYPWWANKFIGANPTDLLAELYETNALKAIQVLKYAGTTTQQMKRFLNQFSFVLILKIIQYLPDGEIAVEAHKQILSAYELNLVAEDAVLILKEKLLLQIIWDQYISNNYSSFNVAFFYNDAIKKFFNWHGVSLHNLFINADDLLQHYEKHKIEKLFHAIRLLHIKQQDIIPEKPLPNNVLYEFIDTLSSLKKSSNFSLHINQLLKKENNFLVDFYAVFRQNGNNKPDNNSLPFKELAFAFIEMLASMPDYRNALLNQPEKIFVENKATGYMEEMDEPLIAGLIYTLAKTTISSDKYAKNTNTTWLLSFIAEYFLQHGNLPPAFSKIGRYTFQSFIKSVLLNLYKTNADQLKNLLEKYYFQIQDKNKFYSLFIMESTADKEILLLLNKIHFKNKIIPIINEPLLIDETTTSNYFTATQYPLLNQYFLNNPKNNPPERIQQITDLLDYYLSWGILKDSNTQLSLTKPIDNLIKESFLFLFKYNRNELNALLQKENHLHSSRIRIFSLFNPQTGGDEALLYRFLKNYIQDDMFNYLLLTESETNSTQIFAEPSSALQHILPVLLKGNFNYNKTELNEIDLIYKAAEVLEYFLLYNKLPDNLNISASINTSEFLKNILRFVFNNNKDRLKSLLGKQTQHPDAKMYLYELFAGNIEPGDANIVSFTNELIDKDLPAFLQYKIGIDFNGTKNEWMSLFEKFADRPTTELKQMLDLILTYSAGASFLAKNDTGINIYKLLEKANKAWADDMLPTIKDLTELFKRNLKDTSYLQILLALLQEFSLLQYAGKINANNPFAFIAIFFVFADERMPVLNPVIYQHMQNFRYYINGIPLFANKAVAMHLQNEIAKRVVYKFSQQQYAKIENETGNKNENFLNIEPTDNNQTIDNNSENNKLIAAPSNTIMQKENKDLLNAANQKTNTIKKTQQAINKPLINKSDILQPSKNLIKEPATDKPGTKIYIQNAGLVLLHPFINTLFDFTDLIKERKFIDEAATFRAIHLLQYLVDGKNEHEEHILALNKILCNYPLIEPIPKEIIFTEKEFNIANELFKIVFQRWHKMKNSSVEGFRQSFLHRQGMLIKNEDNWTLRVEQRGYDLLLQTIPWAYGMIKLPWMQEFLNVEWI